MPLISSNGVLGGRPASLRPGLIATRSNWRPTVTLRTSLVVDIVSRRGASHRVALPAELAGALLLAAAPPGQPGRIIRPPAARHFLSRGEELARVGRIGRMVGGGLERGLRVARWVDHGSYMPAGGQRERDLAAE